MPRRLTMHKIDPNQGSEEFFEEKMLQRGSEISRGLRQKRGGSPHKPLLPFGGGQ